MTFRTRQQFLIRNSKNRNGSSSGELVFRIQELLVVHTIETLTGALKSGGG